MKYKHRMVRQPWFISNLKKEISLNPVQASKYAKAKKPKAVKPKSKE